jgi:nucleotide-binding universal stress UspA family protein
MSPLGLVEPSSPLVSGRIVVGVDGSEHSRRALVWALEEAALNYAALDVVHVWRLPANAPAIGFPTPVFHPDECERAAKELVEAELERAERTTSARPPIVRPLALEGGAARALLGHAEGADLLVVGSRGRGPILGSMLGSVSGHCVHHATTPVVVVAGPR